jgi:hypothetical protein
MAVLRFSIAPEATSRIYDLLLCLAKFGENVSLEARSDKVRDAAQATIDACITDSWSLAHDYCAEYIEDGICIIRSGREDLLYRL